MKKLFAIILTIAMLATLSVTALADDYTTEGDKGMTITYSVAPTYTVTIPSDVTINGSSTTISADDVVVEKGKYVSVSLDADNDFTVTTAQGATLTYTVTANSTAISAGDEILAVNPEAAANGSVTVVFAIDESAIQYAGTYTGTATFTVAVKDAPVTIINFTIDGEPYQAEPGMTWAEWIESDYNTDDFEDDGFGGICSSWYVVCNPGATNSWEDGAIVGLNTEIENGLAYTLFEMVS